jgi:hypothetical protein
VNNSKLFAGSVTSSGFEMEFMKGFGGGGGGGPAGLFFFSLTISFDDPELEIRPQSARIHPHLQRTDKLPIPVLRRSNSED